MGSTYKNKRVSVTDHAVERIAQRVNRQFRDWQPDNVKKHIAWMVRRGRFLQRKHHTIAVKARSAMGDAVLVLKESGDEVVVVTALSNQQAAEWTLQPPPSTQHHPTAYRRPSPGSLQWEL